MGKTPEEIKEFKSMYRDKIKNAREYKQQKTVHTKFTKPEQMRRVYHCWLNNKTESIHGLVVNVFLPKRSYYCQTICRKARTLLAVSIDSVGYYKYYWQLYLDIGLAMTLVTATFYKEMDKKRMANKILQKSPGFQKE